MNKGILQINWDFMGFFASSLCLLHCLLLPLLLMIFPLFGLSFFENELLEMIFVGSSLLIACIAVWKGYVKHRKVIPFFFYVLAIALFSIGFSIHNHFVERGMHLSATFFIILSHFYNWKMRSTCELKSTRTNEKKV